MRRLIAPAAVAVMTAVTLAGAAPAPASAPAPAAAPAIPLLAYYYSWYDVSKWNRAKTDYPKLGRYTSDDPDVIRRHIAWAKAAGVDGFIVSWKDTPTNDRRLQLLMDVARQQDFKLAVIYQGLDFDRNPLPAGRVAADFALLRDSYARDPVFFRLGDKPLTIWSGTWAYSHADVQKVTDPVRAEMLVLNTEKSVEGYQRLADVTDGDAYYWSSVNPQTNEKYGPKLASMSGAVHARGQYWIAPFAPGFDARLVGGEKSVPRRDGTTLRTEYAAAVRSSPDVLGLISWNEFSENSHIEPSTTNGSLYLSVLAELRRTPAPNPPSAQDSSEGPVAGGPGPLRRITLNLGLVGGFLVLLFGGLALLRPAMRRREGGDPPPSHRPALPGLPGTARPPRALAAATSTPTERDRGPNSHRQLRSARQDGAASSSLGRLQGEVRDCGESDRSPERHRGRHAWS